MKTFEIEITGVTPLMMCAFTDEAAQAATAGNRASSVGETKTPQEEAESFLYKDGDDTIIMPQPNIFSCLIAAGKFFKVGKSKVTTLKTSLLPGALMFDETHYPVQHKEPWTVDTRPVRIPSTGGRILRHRPLFNDWKLVFKVTLDTEQIAPKLFRQIVDAAGARLGLGAFRPECKGPYGRFVVTTWQEVETELSVAA